MQIINVKDSTEFVLTESQNFLRNPFVKKKLLRNVFSLYLFLMIPCLVATIWVTVSIDFFNFVKYNAYILAITSMVGFFVGSVLGFSKIVSRKRPWNYLLLLLFDGCYVYCFVGVCVFFANKGFVSIPAMQVSLAVWMILYCLIAKNDFEPKYALIGVAVVLVFNFALFSLILSSQISYLFFYFLVILTMSVAMIYGCREIVRNENYDLLEDDYVLIAFKLVVFFPLIPHLTGDRDDCNINETNEFK